MWIIAAVWIIFGFPWILAQRSNCLEYAIIRADSVQGFSDEQFQGEWYPIVHTEPTEPRSCECDRLTWTLESVSQSSQSPIRFHNHLDATCRLYRDIKFPLSLPISGMLNLSNPGYRMEGLPPLAPLIPNMVVALERDATIQKQTNQEYTAALVYSCQENYLFQPLFESVQILSRIPVRSNQWKEHWIAKAQALGMNMTNPKIPLQGKECKYRPSRI